MSRARIPRRFRTPLTLAAIAAALVAGGVGGIASTRAGLVRTIELVSGTPVEVIKASAAVAAPGPAVLLVHGFAGSRQLMYGIGQSLARHGYVVAIVDLPGHGSNGARATSLWGRGPSAGFNAPLQAALGRLRAEANVDPARIALVGHSMGADAVVRFAMADPAIASTVAMSSGNQQRGQPARQSPRNLLSMAGAWEFDNVRRESLAMAMVAFPQAIPGVTYGDRQAGTARRSVVVPGVEHISVLFSGVAIREIVRWFDWTLGGSAPYRTVDLSNPIGWAIIVYLGVAIGFVPLAHCLFGPPQEESPEELVPEPVPAPHRLLVLGTGMAIAMIALGVRGVRLIPNRPAGLFPMRPMPPRWIPLVTGDYLAGFFLVAGIVMLAGVLLTRRPALSLLPDAGTLWRSLIVTVYVVAGFGVAAHVTWLNYALVGERQWIAAALFPVWLIFFVGDEWLLRGTTGLDRTAWQLGSKALVVVALVFAVAAGRAPYFLLLLAPALLPLFVLQSFYAVQLSRVTSHGWPAAIASAALFAWTMAAVFPLA